jgi:hypothetical protein
MIVLTYSHVSNNALLMFGTVPIINAYNCVTILIQLIHEQRHFVNNLVNEYVLLWVRRESHSCNLICILMGKYIHILKT